MPVEKIEQLINRLWDRFWSGGIANPLTAIEQITYLLFIRMLDEMDLKKTSNSNLTKENYKSIFNGRFKIPGTKETILKEKLRWSKFKSMEPEEMLLHVQNKVFPFIKKLKGKHSSFSKYMSNAVFIIPKASLLTEAVNIIDEIYNEIKKESNEKGHTFNDTQGDTYEYLLKELKTSGKNGQFRTPRHIINLIVDLIEPSIKDKIADPACGTGGFLLASYQYILTQQTSKAYQRTDVDGFKRGILGDKLLNKNLWDKLNKNTFYGFDFDTTMVRIGLMNLILHGIDGARVNYIDTLSKKFADENEYTKIMTNPPFKGNIDKNDINKNLILKTTKTELLFIEKILRMLINGGTAGIILPDGVLFGSSSAHKKLRKKLIDENTLLCVISLPGGVFKPYAGVKTSILIFLKGGITKKVWYYDLKSDGYTLDEKRRRIPNKYPLIDILNQYKKKTNPNYKQDKKVHFFVDIKKIRELNYDLNINLYKKYELETKVYDSPKKILNIIRQEEKRINKILDDFKRITV